MYTKLFARYHFFFKILKIPALTMTSIYPNMLINAFTPAMYTE